MLSSLELNQFRCFESLRLELQEGLTIFVGNNAQGKTSILEAACVLLRLQSPRTSALADLSRVGPGAGKGFSLNGQFGDSGLSLRNTSKSGRKLAVDGETQGRSSGYLRYSGLVVWIASDDLTLVKDGGGPRRRYLDFMASQIYPLYRPALKAYERALRSRNFLLKRDASPKWDQIDAYTKILIENGEVLTRHRRELVTALAPLAAASQKQISEQDEILGIDYAAASGEGDDLGAELFRRRSDEQRRRQTLAGPHRDNLVFTVNEMPAAKFASEGQQRTLALSLKLAQSRLFIEKTEQAPVLLIDDVFGELDPDRRNALMAAWPEGSQKLVTTTHLNWLDSKRVDAKIMQVDSAQVSGA
ncbi:MAG: DNA replication and repair protein RecF [Verrucomicrobia bacterium]|nr:DNA replication and repair protein RecF [Verrucomicrobiota bacterium]